MAIYLGSSSPGIRVGSAQAQAVYLGASQVWSAAPTFSTLGYTRLWATTNKSGAVSGSASSDTGQYSVKWWDGSIQSFSSGSVFSKSGSGVRAFEVYPSLTTGTSLLLHFDGSNGSTTFSNSSPLSLAVTANGAAQISTSQGMFGTSSGLFGGEGDYLTVTGISLGASDFTIEGWFYLPSIPSSGTYSTFFAHRDSLGSVGGACLVLDGATLLYFISNESSQWQVSGNATGFTVSAGQWFHLALVRSGGQCVAYLNGTAGTPCTVSGSVGTNGNFSIMAGSSSGGQEVAGYCDDFRVTAGTAVYTANFTPPSSALTSTSVSTTAFGQFDGFDVSANEITKLRAESVSLSSAAGYSQKSWNKTYGNQFTYIPGMMKQGNLSSNSLDAAALDQFYADLLSGSGALYVAGNTGIATDTPAIATAKGYTVYGSVPPYTSLLCNFNGSNGSTTFTNSSPNALTLAASGSAAISTAQSKFGGSSLYLAGDGYVTAAGQGNQFNFGADDFTIELWFRDDGTSGEVALITTADSTDQQGVWLGISSAGTLYWLLGNGSWKFVNATDSSSVRDGAWHHVVYVRSSATAMLFLDGAQVTTQSIGQGYEVTNTNSQIRIGGRDLYGQYFKGWIDDVRVVAGKAIYIANFTPPAAQLAAWYP